MKNKKETPLIDFRNKVNPIFGNRKFLNVLKLAASTFFYNILKNMIFLPKLFLKRQHKKDIKKIVILGFGGIGNHLTLLPLIRNIRKSKEKIGVHLCVTSNACAELFKYNLNVDSISLLNIGEFQSFINYYKAGRKIKILEPDAVIAASGTDPVAGSLISFLSKANYRVGEDWKGRGFLYTHKVKANHKISELKQNIKLIKFLGISCDDKSYTLSLNREEINEANRWLSDLSIPFGTKLIGVHPGSGNGQKWKRWDLKNFIQVSDNLSRAKNIKTLFFLGPDEMALKKEIETSMLKNPIISSGDISIRTTAAKIRCCDVFLSNDSGLRHVAVATGVKTVGIFGPTSIKKNAMISSEHNIIVNKNVACNPCHYKKWFLACEDKKPCLNLISVDEVVNRVLGKI